MPQTDTEAPQDARGIGSRLPVLHHINLKTIRLDAMIAWYGDVVGMRVTHRFRGGAWLTNDEANHRLALIYSDQLRDDPDKLGHTGIHHLAFEYDGIDDLFATYQRLARRGILPHACLDHGMTMSFYYVDPDGNSVELQYDEFGAWAESKAFMEATPEFSANPIGVPVDPELAVAARAAGADRDEIHRRAYAGEFLPPTELDLRVPLA